MRLYDTYRAEKRPLTPRRPGHVGIYVCGPTVYDHAHIGHARAAVVFDVVVRALRRRHEVTFVRNLTDVDDKIIQRAAAAGETPTALSARFIADFQRDMAALGCLPPDIEPKVTDHIPQIVALVAELVASGHAYAAGGDVYYAVERFATYGRLAKRTLGDMEAGARVEVVAHKRHPMDFVLWKAAKPGEPAWPSPWGEGRPGWHIECSAMSREYLGPCFDIHGGGRDLIFPHHENEIAQTEALGHGPMAQIWLHNGLINVDDIKMSKSLGNVATVAELLATIEPEAVRLYLLSTHYRAPLEYTAQGLRDAEVRLSYVYETLARLDATSAAAAPARTDAASAAPDAPAPARANAASAAPDAQVLALVDAALDDDLNTPQALAAVSALFPRANALIDGLGGAPSVPTLASLASLAATIRAAGTLLGLFCQPPAAALARLAARRQAAAGVDAAEIDALVAARDAARASRDFARADALRAQLDARGVVLRDGPEGTRWSVARAGPADAEAGVRGGSAL